MSSTSPTRKPKTFSRDRKNHRHHNNTTANHINRNHNSSDSEMTIHSDKPRFKGIVKFFSAQKGYGFILPYDSSQVNIHGRNEVFVHHTAIYNNGGFKSLAEGELVEYELTEGKNGMQAAIVTGPNGAPVLGDRAVGTQPYLWNYFGIPQGDPNGTTYFDPSQYPGFAGAPYNMIPSGYLPPPPSSHRAGVPFPVASIGGNPLDPQLSHAHGYYPYWMVPPTTTTTSSAAPVEGPNGGSPLSSPETEA